MLPRGARPGLVKPAGLAAPRTGCEDLGGKPFHEGGCKSRQATTGSRSQCCTECRRDLWALGVSQSEAHQNATEATVFGPFFEGSPEIESGGDIAAGASREPCWVEGTVTHTDGQPVPHALIEVWEADQDGFYDVQYDGSRIAARGHLMRTQAAATASGKSPLPHTRFLTTARSAGCWQ